LADPEALLGFRVLDPATANRSTPRDMTALLARIWRDEAGSAAGCDEMRRVLRLQVCRHRLGSGFPGDDVRVAGKTGNLLNLRGEVGVVELADGHRYAVAVFHALEQRRSEQSGSRSGNRYDGAHRRRPASREARVTPCVDLSDPVSQDGGDAA